MNEERESGRLVAATTEQSRTPELIGAEIRMYAEAGRRVTLLCAIEIGRRLPEAKGMLDHGQWLPWLKKETEFSTSSASRYMQIFENYSSTQLGLFGPESNFPTLGNISVSKALALLALPEEERESFAEAHDVEAMSTRQLEDAIRERDEALKRAQKAEQELLDLEDGQQLALDELRVKLDQAREDAEKGRAALREKAKSDEELEALSRQLEAARDSIRELQNRPAATVVERDEEAIQQAAREAKAKADAEWAEKLGKIQKKLDKAEKEKAKAEDAAKSAGQENSEAVRKAEQELERARAELAEAKKQLKASNGNVAAFGVLFRAVQEDINKMFDKLLEITQEDEETAAKLRGGAKVILSKTLERLG